jgi:hypothetical protein
VPAGTFLQPSISIISFLCFIFSEFYVVQLKVYYCTMFSPDLIRNTINRQSSSSSSSNLRPSPPSVPVVHVSVATAEEGQQLASSLHFISIEGVVETVRRSTTPISGCETPSSCNDGKSDGKPAAKVVGKGMEKGSMVYSVDEHIAVLLLMLSEPDSSMQVRA